MERIRTRVTIISLFWLCLTLAMPLSDYLADIASTITLVEKPDMGDMEEEKEVKDGEKKDTKICPDGSSLCAESAGLRQFKGHHTSWYGHVYESPDPPPELS